MFRYLSPFAGGVQIVRVTPNGCSSSGLKNRTISADEGIMRHPEGRDVHQRARLRVGGKFSLAVGIVLLAMLGVTASGAVGLARLQSKIDLLYDDNIVTNADRYSNVAQ